MKVYTCPEEVPFAKPDWKNFNLAAEQAREKAHTIKLAEWLRANGYTGKHTGKIVSFGVADGRALYMIADGKKSCLVHLPYCDAYVYRDVEYLPKAEIVRRADRTPR